MNMHCYTGDSVIYVTCNLIMDDCTALYCTTTITVYLYKTVLLYSQTLVCQPLMSTASFQPYSGRDGGEVTLGFSLVSSRYGLKSPRREKEYNLAYDGRITFKFLWNIFLILTKTLYCKFSYTVVW